MKEGWYLRNTRLPRAVRFSSPTRLVSDKDLATVHDSFDEADRAWRNDFLRRHDIGWFAGTDFSTDGSGRIGMSVERSWKLEPFQNDELVTMQRAMTQLRRALSLAPALDDAAARGLLAGLETMGNAGALLDRGGRVMLLNARAERLLGTTILLRDGYLRAKAPQADQRLQRLVASLVREGSRWDDDAIGHVMLRSADSRPVVVRGAPIAPIGAELFKRAKAFVTFTIIGQAQPPHANALREAFGLTPAETRVAIAIAGGFDVNDIASRQGVSSATIRTQLKAIFAKTDTRRQTALALLVARIQGASSAPIPD